MSDITRREFIRRSIIIAAGATLISSCEDNQSSPSEENPIITSSPGMLSGNRPSQFDLHLLIITLLKVELQELNLAMI